MTLTETPRAPKQDRSRDTRDRILETAMDCLVTRGWQGTTTLVVADLSGVSRGALQHHFPTREDLVDGVLGHMYENRISGQFTINTVVPEGLDVFDFLVEQVLGYYASDHFKAALQIWTAATGNKHLQEQLVPYERRFARALYDQAVAALDADVSDERTHRLIQSTLDLARGLGLADVLSDDSHRRKSITQFWAGELRSIKRLGSANE